MIKNDCAAWSVGYHPKNQRFSLRTKTVRWKVNCIKVSLMFVSDFTWLFNCDACVPWLLATTPLAGRMAFAAVFGVLIAWLLWIPNHRLRGESANEPPASDRAIAAARYSAVVIAAIQMLLYLFWE